MKKLACLLLILSCLFGLTSCSWLNSLFESTIEYSSLEDYIIKVKRYHGGNSDLELDHPEFFLPSASFFDDYRFIDGGYYTREASLGTIDDPPEVSILYLRYEEKIYLAAKEYTLEKIEPYGDKFYPYNNYVFYENSNFIALKQRRDFPEYFTMACYNDTNYTLLFIGFYVLYFSDENEHFYDIENNWESFVDEYFGEYYDFSK